LDWRAKWSYTSRYVGSTSLALVGDRCGAEAARELEFADREEAIHAGLLSKIDHTGARGFFDGLVRPGRSQERRCESDDRSRDCAEHGAAYVVDGEVTDRFVYCFLRQVGI